MKALQPGVRMQTSAHASRLGWLALLLLLLLLLHGSGNAFLNTPLGASAAHGVHGS